MRAWDRRPVAWLTAVIGAEYLLGWLPNGMHHYRKLVNPTEPGNAFQVLHRTGVRVSPLNRAFSFSGDEGVNDMVVFHRGVGA